MVSTFTPNINLEEPARGDYVGTWDTPVNSNMTLVDLVEGGQTSINAAAGNVTLSAAQFQCKTITFNSTLLANIAITFPSSFMKSYEIYNTCTGSSAFTITLQTTVAAAGYVCAPPGEICEVVNIAGQIRFKNLGRVGEYWDYGGSSVPTWVSGSNPPPYLPCDGTGFSSASYPILATILGSTTTPDTRGRFRATLNGGTGRLSSAAQGLDGNTRFATGSGITLSSSFIPTLTATGNNTVTVTPNGFYTLTAGNATIIDFPSTPGSGLRAPGNTAAMSSNAQFTGNNSISVTYTNSSPATDAGAPPSYIGGITMIRAG